MKDLQGIEGALSLVNLDKPNFKDGCAIGWSMI